MKISSKFDKQFVKVVIGDLDAIALIKEYFILKGNEKVKDHAKMINKILGGKVKRVVIEKALSEVHRYKDDVSFDQVGTKATRFINAYFQRITCGST